jgi:homoserine O-acetyltransferase
LSHPSVDASLKGISASLPRVPDTDDNAVLEVSLQHALSLLPPALVIGIESDGLFTTTEQKELAAYIPHAELVLIPSQDGHDGFLLEFEAINGWIDGWLKRKMPEFFGDDARVISPLEYAKGQQQQQQQAGFAAQKESVFGEAEADVTRW